MKYPRGVNSPRRQMWCQACGSQIRANELPEHATTCVGLARHRAELADREDQRPPLEVTPAEESTFLSGFEEAAQRVNTPSHRRASARYRGMQQA